VVQGLDPAVWALGACRNACYCKIESVNGRGRRAWRSCPGNALAWRCGSTRENCPVVGRPMEHVETAVHMIHTPQSRGRALRYSGRAGSAVVEPDVSFIKDADDITSSR